MRPVDLYEACPHIDELFNALVPDSGKADTKGGEVVRAVERIVYRFLNDGDYIGYGYGNETCNAPARYLTEERADALSGKSAKFLCDALSGITYNDEDYSDRLLVLMNDACAYCDNNEDSKKPNEDDMWNWRTDSDLDYHEEDEEDDYWYEDEEEYEEDEEEDF